MNGKQVKTGTEKTYDYFAYVLIPMWGDKNDENGKRSAHSGYSKWQISCHDMTMFSRQKYTQTSHTFSIMCNGWAKRCHPIWMNSLRPHRTYYTVRRLDSHGPSDAIFRYYPLIIIIISIGSISVLMYTRSTNTFSFTLNKIHQRETEMGETRNFRFHS